MDIKPIPTSTKPLVSSPVFGSVCLGISGGCNVAVGAITSCGFNVVVVLGAIEVVVDGTVDVVVVGKVEVVGITITGILTGTVVEVVVVGASVVEVVVVGASVVEVVVVGASVVEVVEVEVVVVVPQASMGAKSTSILSVPG
jgi:hypothetical protein